MVPNARVSRAEVITLALILALGVGLRLLAITELREIGFFRHPMSDARVYVERARQIAAGDWLGPADFVHAPLYSYFLAALCGVSDDFAWTPRIAQALLSAITGLAVYALSRRLFGVPAGLVAAGLLALWTPAIFFDALIQKASLTLLLAALVLASAVHAAESRRAERAWWGWGLAGAALGLLVLNRQHALVYLPLIALWALASPAASPPPLRRSVRFSAAAAAIAACVLVVLPWVCRNRAVLGDWVLTTPNLGQNLAMGVGPAATGMYRPAQPGFGGGEREQIAWTREAEAALGRPLSAAEVSNYFRDAALAWIRANPLAWLGLTLRKVGLTWSAYESPDTEDYYLYIEHSSTLRRLDAAGMHLGLVAPLAAIGILLSARELRRLWPLHAWLVVTTVSLALFVIFARYRLPLVPVLLSFAGIGVVRFIRIAREGKWRTALGVGAVGLGVWLAVNVPVANSREPSPVSRSNHAIALAEQGRLNAALGELERATARQPANVDINYVYGTVLLDSRRYAEALARFEAARNAAPQYAAAWRGIADALDALGRSDEALASYREALRRDPSDVVSRSSIGAALARRGAFVAALEHLRAAVQAQPNYAEAQLNLGNTLLGLGQLEEADQVYARALALRPAYVDAWFNRGVLAMQRSEPARALEYFETVLTLRPSHPEAQRALIEVLWSLGRHAVAVARLEEMLVREPARDDLAALLARLKPLGGETRP